MEPCHSCKLPQCEWTCVRCTKGKDCRELYCFTCISKKYPWMYGGLFRHMSWACPACLGLCQCTDCTDPVKKEERQAIARAKYQEEEAFIAAHKEELRIAAANAKERLIYPATQRTRRERRDSLDCGESISSPSWSCPRCSVINNADDLECNACYWHKKRSTRKRKPQVEAESPLYEDKHSHQHDKKEHRDTNLKRAKEYSLVYDDSFPPAKGRVSALRQLVKKPWADGWELARHLALDLVEEAKQQAIKQGTPVSQVRQLPTKFQLGNNRATHVRKWFDREPTLAKKFLRAAGLICSKSNGTFIKEHIRNLDDLPPLIRAAHLGSCDESASGDDGDDSFSASSSPSSLVSSASGTPLSLTSPSDFGSPNKSSYQPKLKVYYHSEGEKNPFVFKVPVTDLKSMDELHIRLNTLLREMGQISPLDMKKLVLTAGSQPLGASSDDISTSSVEDLSRRSLIHVYAQG